MALRLGREVLGGAHGDVAVCTAAVSIDGTHTGPPPCREIPIGATIDGVGCFSCFFLLFLTFSCFLRARIGDRDMSFRRLVPRRLRKSIRNLATHSRRTLQINYKPVPRVRYGWGTPGHAWIEPILAHHDARQIRFIESMTGYRDDFNRIAAEEPKSTSSTEPYWRNLGLPPIDAMALYTVLVENRPKTYLEIGSGNSTKFARRAITDHDLTTRIVSVEPKIRPEIDAVSDTNHCARLEDVDLSIFDGLGKGDVIFFDGSHRCFQNSDVTVFFLEVLPRLQSGVVVGIHDIFWPNDYPAESLDKYYSEQYMLGAYLLGRGTSLPIIFSSAYAASRFESRVRAALPNTLQAPISGGMFLFSIPG